MGPLSQVTVIECGEGIAAAFAGRLLADLGAHVIKVESAQGDIARLRGPFRGDLPDLENSGLFLYLNAGKRGITLDLHNAGDRDEVCLAAPTFCSIMCRRTNAAGLAWMAPPWAEFSRN
jgi:crotonobetainyl-CoA:carnitine CoA-transferase CaiB-like acyl-CoA transferase